MRGYEVKAVTYKETKPYILGIHYAKRMPNIMFPFGLFLDGELRGVVTFGMPASPFLCKGVCGEEFKRNVLELNRLCLKYNIKNEASMLVSSAIKMLPRPRIIVSYADTSQGHLGFVYQACNFMFTGTTKPRTDIASENGKHSRHHSGDSSRRVYRSAKHRYVTFTGSKKEKRLFLNSLRYPVMEYPKQV